MTYGKRFNRTPILSLEDAEEQVVVTPPAETVVENTEPVEQVVEDHDVDEETQELGDAVEETTVDIEGATGDTENLEAVADELEATLPEGGALPQTIAVAEVAVESYIKNLTGKKPSKRVLLSLESYGGINSRAHATKLAVENIREMAGKAWAAIVDLFKKSIDFIRSLVDKMVGGFSSLKNKIKGLRKAKDENKDKFEKMGPEISIPRRIWANMKMGGKFTKELFFKGLQNTKNFFKKIIAWFGIGKKTIAEAKPMELLKDGRADQEDAKLEFPINPKPLVDATAALGKVEEKNEDGTVVVGILEQLPGDAKVDVTGPGVVEIDGQYYKAAATMDINITNVGEEEDPEDVTIKSFTASEVDQALNDAEELIDLGEKASEITKETIDVQAVLVKDAEAASKIDEEKKGGTFRRAATKVRGWFSAAGRSLTKVGKAILFYIRKVIAGIFGVIAVVFASIGVTAGLIGLGSAVVGGAVNPE